MCRQVNWLFNAPVLPNICDIDFSQWYDCVSMIVDYDEYMGDDFPICGVVQLKFINVHLFTFQKNTTEKQMLSLHIKEFSKELDKETGKRYYCLVLVNTCVLEEVCRLEIHFEDAEVKFLSHSLNSESGYGGFLSPKEREQLLRNQ